MAVEIEAPVVFAGYGYRNEKAGYDDFKGVDVRGKIILCLHGFPGHADTLSNAYKAIRADDRQTPRFIEREKSRIASSLGVAGIIEIGSGEEVAEDWASNLPFRYNSRDYEGDVPRASFYEYRMKIPGDTLEMEPVRLTVSGRVLNPLLKDSGIDPEEFEQRAGSTLKPASSELKGKTLHLKTSVDSRLIRARNVIGVLPGKDTSEAIVVGAHYDHLGKHDGWIWNGADDNASGTVGVMTLAKAFMASGEVPEKTIVFAAWTGEEKGLLGSTYYTGHPWNSARTLVNLNYDMISRDNKDDTLGIRCSMTYTKNHSILKELVEKNNQQYGLGLEITYRPSERPRGGSDHAPFAEKGIPIFYFMAGFPPEYHQPNDHTDLVNWDKMVNIIKIGYLSTWDLANSDWGPDSDGNGAELTLWEQDPGAGIIQKPGIVRNLQVSILQTADDYRSILPRLIVGLVFLSEGIQKFLFPEMVGAGRFAKIGFEHPDFLASFVATVEILCGGLIFIGMSARIAAIPLFIIMITAIATTKIPVLLEKGFWQMAHDSRTDYAMTLLIVFIFIYGSGKLSVDYLILRRLKSK